MRYPDSVSCCPLPKGTQIKIGGLIQKYDPDKASAIVSAHSSHTERIRRNKLGKQGMFESSARQDKTFHGMVSMLEVASKKEEESPCEAVFDGFCKKCVAQNRCSAVQGASTSAAFAEPQIERVKIIYTERCVDSFGFLAFRSRSRFCSPFRRGWVLGFIMPPG